MLFYEIRKLHSFFNEFMYVFLMVLGKQRINSAMLILKVKSINIKRPAKKEALNIIMMINDLKFNRF